MSVLALASLLASVMAAFLGNFVLYRNPRNALNRVFFLFCLSAAYASFTEFGYRQAETFATAYFWLKAGFLWTFILPSELHFVLLFSKKTKLLENKLTYFLLYGPASTFSFLHLINLFGVEPVKAYWGWTYTQPENPIMDGVLGIWSMGIVLLSLYLCLQYYLKATEQTKKRQSWYIFLGVLISAVMGSVTELLPPYLKIMVPELTSVGIAFECVFVAYAMWRYELFALTPATAAASIISTMADTLLLVSPAGKIVTVNQATLDLLGYEESELIDQPSEIILAREGKKLQDSHLKRLLAGGPVTDLETTFKTKDGKKIPISLAGSVMRDEDGVEWGTVYVGRDLTERKRAEEALRRAEVETRRRLKEQAALREAGAVITSTLDLAGVLSRIAEQMGLVIDATSAYICTAEPEAGTSTVVAEYFGPHACAQERVSDLGVTHVETDVEFLKALQAGRPSTAHVDDPDLDEYEREHMQQYGAKSVLDIPLYTRGQVIGFAELWESRRRREFTSEEIALCQAIARNATMAIENARLFESERRQRQRAEMLLETSKAVVSTLDLGQVLLTLARQLLDISGFHICAISEWDRRAEQIRILAEHTRAVWPPGGGEIYPLSDFPATERVLTSGQPEVIRAGMDDPELSWMDEMGLATLLMLPLRAGEEIIGLVEIGSTKVELTSDGKAVLRCQQVLQEAALGLKSPPWANADDELLTLAGRLAEAGGGSWCSLSAWHQPEGEVRTLAEYSDLVWSPGMGPSYHPEDYLVAVSLMEKNESATARLSDPTIEPLDRNELVRWGTRTLVTQPLSVKGEPIGLVELYNVTEERRVSDDELRLWRAVADQAAVAVENARLFGSEQRQRQTAETLLETSAALTSTLDLGQVLLTLADQLTELSGFHNCRIAERDRKAEQTRSLAEHTRAVWPDGGEPYPLSDFPATERVLTSGQPEVVQVGMDDPELTWMLEMGLVALLMFPLRAGEEIIGLAEIGSTKVELASDENAMLRCQQALQEAASWLKSPLWSNSSAVLLELAGRLVEVGGGSWCSLSAWYQPQGETRSIVEYGDSIWPPGTGPVARLADYPSETRAVDKGQSTIVRLSDPTLDRRDRDELAEWSARTLVTQPISIKGKPVGMIQLYDVVEERIISDDELRLWRAVADQAAVALENARLYEQARQEIVERMRAEGQIRASLREKEVLLKEIHHRVKNNLQVISSLLYLQSQNVGDALSLEMLRDSQNRVRSMALVHEKLYQSEDLARVDFAGYISSLINHLFQSYGVNSSLIGLKTSVDDFAVDIDTAIPCGLILNELISNSLKHAFPDGRAGEIHVELRSDNAGQFTLLVSDNGIGLPEDWGLRETESLGLQLVNTLVNQLGGTIELDGSGGTAFKITFAAPV